MSCELWLKLADWMCSVLHPHQGPTQTPGRIAKVDRPLGTIIYTIGVLEYRKKKYSLDSPGGLGQDQDRLLRRDGLKQGT